MGDQGSRESRGSNGDKGRGAERTDSAGLTELADVELLIHVKWYHGTLTLSRNNLVVTETWGQEGDGGQLS